MVECTLLSVFRVSFHSTDSWVALSMQNGYTSFTPYFKVRKCAFNADSDECKNNCIRKGRYCAADSIGDKFKGKFSGKQVRTLHDYRMCPRGKLI